MVSKDDSSQQGDLENQVWNAISAFEQIVEMMPDDRVSLEALSHAYEQVGDLSRAREYLSRLVNVVISGKDRPAASLLHERVIQFAASDPISREIQSRLDDFLAMGDSSAKSFEMSGETVRQAALKIDDAEQRNAHVASELAFAWTLFQAGELSQQEYAAVAQDLGTTSGQSAHVTVSVLHALHDRGNRSLDRIIGFAGRDADVPVIPLSLFDVQDSVFQLLPRDFMIRYGVMAFETMGNDVLVVVLNPYNKALLEKVEALIGRRCHFFLTPPAEFDLTLEKHVVREAGKTAEQPAITP
jgi:tetratricopeptide (TPR) repeat protein